MNFIHKNHKVLNHKDKPRVAKPYFFCIETYNVDNYTFSLSSLMILGCVKLTSKRNYHTPFVNLT